MYRRFWEWIQIHLPAVVTYGLAGRCFCRLVLSGHRWGHRWQEWALRRCLGKVLSALVCELAFILHLCASNTLIIHGRVGWGVRDRRTIRRKEETGPDTRLWRGRGAVPRERGNMVIIELFLMLCRGSTSSSRFTKFIFSVFLLVCFSSHDRALA